MIVASLQRKRTFLVGSEDTLNGWVNATFAVAGYEGGFTIQRDNNALRILAA